MIIGFSAHGTGGGSGPIEYLMSPTRQGREESIPIAIRGNPEQTRDLINSLDFKWKYTSGVLSFEPGEVITKDMENTIIDGFEAMAFAGLEKDQYNILWVRHAHAGHHELHFVTPRVELETGKSLNIKPPGKGTEKQYDDYRSMINARYGLSDPEDPRRARIHKSLSKDIKQAREMERAGHATEKGVRELITEAVLQQVELGLVNDRNDILNAVKELGFEITRQGKDYITALDPNDNQRYRLRGQLYERDFSPEKITGKARSTGRTNQPTLEHASPGYDHPNPERAGAFEKRVHQHTEKRAKYHRARYAKAISEHGLAHDQSKTLMAIHDGHRSLSGFIARELGEHAIPCPTDSPNQGSASAVSRTQATRWQNTVELVRRSHMRSDRHERTTLPERLPSPEGELNNDRTRDPIVSRLERFRDAVQRATQRFRAITSTITHTVQTYLERQRGLSLIHI